MDFGPTDLDQSVLLQPTDGEGEAFGNKEKMALHRKWSLRGTVVLGGVLLVACGYFFGRESGNTEVGRQLGKKKVGQNQMDLPPHVHHSYDQYQNFEILPSATISRLFGNVDKIDVPEFVDPRLLAEVDAIHDGYAKIIRLPHQCRMRFITYLTQDEAVAVLVGEKLAFRDGTDTELRFRQESNFHYFTGFDHAGARLILGLDPNSDVIPAGSVWLFVQKGNAVWEGRTETLQDFIDNYDIDDAFWMEDFDSKLQELNVKTVFTFPDVDINIPIGAEHDISTHRNRLSSSRVIKTEAEISAMRAAAEVGVQEHIVVMQNVRCGNYESDAESLFRYVGHNYGMKFQAYIPIIGSAGNSAALHYNDNSQKIPDDSLVLIDAGPEIGSSRVGGGYGTDITRTWPCSGLFTEAQRQVYDIVQRAQAKCVEMCVPGSSMTEASLRSTEIILQGLLDVRILQGADVDRLRELRMHSIFMPHGLGHSVGIDVHDPGSITPFAPGMVLTCEPGIYFIPSLIEPAYEDPIKGPLLNKELIESTFINMGGFRIEDTVLITEDGPDNLSGGLPRTSTEVEELMKGGYKILQKHQSEN